MKDRKGCSPDFDNVWIDRMIVILLVFVPFLVLAFLIISDPDAGSLLRESWFTVDLQGEGASRYQEVSAGKGVMARRSGFAGSGPACGRRTFNTTVF